jgi:hypothetical protein
MDNPSDVSSIGIFIVFRYTGFALNLLATEFYIKNLAHPVRKM